MANLGEGEYGEFGDYGEGYLSQADAGSGAYTVKSHNKQDITVMTRFDNYLAQLVNRMRHLVMAAARQARSLAPGARPTRWNQLR